jgi:hypothetical protein
MNLHFKPNTTYCVNMKSHEHEKNHSPIDALDVGVQGYVDLYFSTQKDTLK